MLLFVESGILIYNEFSACFFIDLVYLCILNNITACVYMQSFNFDNSLELIVHDSPDAILMIDHQLIVCEINRRFCEIFEQPKTFFSGKSLNELIEYFFEGEALDEIRTVLHRLTDGSPLSLKYDLKYRNSHFDVHLLTNTKSKYIYLIFKDVTDYHRALKELRASEHRYRMLSGLTFEGILIHKDARLLDCNASFLEMLGYERVEIEGMDLLELIPLVEDRMRVVENVAQRVHLPYEITVRRKDGTVFPAELEAKNVVYHGEEMRIVAVRNISERKILMERNVLLSRAVEQSPVSIVLTDANASIEYVNPIFEQRTGYSFEEAVGQNPRILQSGYHSKAFYQQMWEVLANGKTWQGELKNRTKAGEVLWESVSISPIFNEMGSVEHFVGVKEDITSRIETLEELRLAKEKAEESNRLKSAFLATMSHELRTPLNQIIGFSEIIPKLTQDESIVDFAKQINKSGNELFALIEDIFQMAMVEHSPVLLRRNKVEIGLIIRLLNESLHEIVQVSGKLEFLETSVEVEPGLESKVIVIDKPKVIQAVTQLIRNAVKFTSNGFVRIKVSLSDDLLLSIAVADSGIGIPENKLDIIFDFFRQADESLTRVYGGVGIGLALSKKIAEALNANIYVETKVNEGSTFTFVVPVENGTSE